MIAEEKRRKTAHLDRLAGIIAQLATGPSQKAQVPRLIATPLRALVAARGIVITHIDDSREHRTLGKLGFKGFIGNSDARVMQRQLFADKTISIQLVNEDDTFTARFTLAHELAHFVLETEIKENGLSSQELELVCDKAAARILVPDQISDHLKEFAADLHLRLFELERIARILKVNISVLLARLNELPNCRFRNGAFTVAMERSRKRSTDLAPRIVARYMPRGWFLPTNKRLSNLGLNKLVESFFDAAPFKTFEEDGNVLLWNSRLRKLVQLSVSLTYKCYEVKTPPTTRRHMLAVIDTDMSRVVVDN